MAFSVKKHIFITGAYRSGTTLLHHLLDGHPELLVFPVENCFIRDYQFSHELPNPHLRNLNALKPLMENADYEGMIHYFLKHEKLELPLHRKLVLKGSTGNQIINTGFSIKQFKTVFCEYLGAIKDKEGSINIRDLFDSYTESYFQAIGIESENKSRFIVNKCPDKGACIEYYLEHYPTAKIIHLERDPRAVVSSHKSDLPKAAIIPHKKMLDYIDVQKAALSRRKQFESSGRITFVKYENLTTNPISEMKKLSKFLEIPFDNMLTRPSILGEPWQSNSSFSTDRSDTTKVYAANISKYRKKLNNLELRYVETFCFDSMKDTGYEPLIVTTAPTEKDKTDLISEYSNRALLNLRSYFSRARQKIKHIWKNIIA